ESSALCRRIPENRWISHSDTGTWSCRHRLLLKTRDGIPGLRCKGDVRAAVAAAGGPVRGLAPAAPRAARGAGGRGERPHGLASHRRRRPGPVGRLNNAAGAVVRRIREEARAAIDAAQADLEQQRSENRALSTARDDADAQVKTLEGELYYE